jgi:Ca2+-binding EF-hand superfamily protein
MNELLLVLDVISNPDKKERARFNFTLMDLDGNGKLDRSELKRLLQLTFMGAQVNFFVEKKYLLGFCVSCLFQVALELELASRPEIVVNEHDSKIVHRLFSDPKVLSHSIDELVSAADLDKDGFVQEAEYVAWIENEKAIEKFQKFVSAKIEHSAIENAELAKLVAESFQNLLNFF